MARHKVTHPQVRYDWDLEAPKKFKIEADNGCSLNLGLEKGCAAVNRLLIVLLHFHINIFIPTIKPHTGVRDRRRFLDHHMPEMLSLESLESSCVT